MVLKELIYWFSDDSQKERPRANILRKGRRWYVHTHEQWQQECEISQWQFRQVLSMLKRKGIIHTCVMKHGNPSMTKLAISLNTEAVVELMNTTMQRRREIERAGYAKVQAAEASDQGEGADAMSEAEEEQDEEVRKDGNRPSRKPETIHPASQWPETVHPDSRKPAILCITNSNTTLMQREQREQREQRDQRDQRIPVYVPSPSRGRTFSGSEDKTPLPPLTWTGDGWSKDGEASVLKEIVDDILSLAGPHEEGDVIMVTKAVEHLLMEQHSVWHQKYGDRLDKTTDRRKPVVNYLRRRYCLEGTPTAIRGKLFPDMIYAQAGEALGFLTMRTRWSGAQHKSYEARIYDMDKILLANNNAFCYYIEWLQGTSDRKAVPLERFLSDAALQSYLAFWRREQKCLQLDAKDGALSVESMSTTSPQTQEP